MLNPVFITLLPYWEPPFHLSRLAWLTQASAALLKLDGDHAGQKASSAIAETLQHRTHILAHELPNGMEPEDLTDNQLNLIATNFLLFFEPVPFFIPQQIINNNLSL